MNTREKFDEWCAAKKIDEWCAAKKAMVVAEVEYRRISNELAELSCPYKVADEVIITRVRSGKEFKARVIKVEAPLYPEVHNRWRCWFSIYKKDGSLSKMQESIDEWNKGGIKHVC